MPDAPHAPERRHHRRRFGDAALDLRPPEALVVDPNTDQCDLARYTLGLAGVSVLVAHDGVQAAERARDHQPDVIITELTLPHLDGFSLIERLRRSEWTNSIPIVALTASAEPAVTTRALAAGALMVIHKPTSPDYLIDTVTDLLRQTAPAVRQERRLREVLLSLRRIAVHYSPDPLARERLSRLINRLQESVLMFDDQGRMLAQGDLTDALRQVSSDLARRCVASPMTDLALEPALRTVQHPGGSGNDEPAAGGAARAICVSSGIAGVHFAALLVA